MAEAEAAAEGRGWKSGGRKVEKEEEEGGRKMEERLKSEKKAVADETGLLHRAQRALHTSSISNYMDSVVFEEEGVWVCLWV